MKTSTALAAVRRAVASHGTERAAALHLGVSPQYLNDVLHARRQPGPKLLKALGMEKVVTYKSRKGGKK